MHTIYIYACMYACICICTQNPFSILGPNIEAIVLMARFLVISPMLLLYKAIDILRHLITGAHGSLGNANPQGSSEQGHMPNKYMSVYDAHLWVKQMHGVWDPVASPVITTTTTPSSSAPSTDATSDLDGGAPGSSGLYDDTDDYEELMVFLEDFASRIHDDPRIGQDFMIPADWLDILPRGSSGSYRKEHTTSLAILNNTLVAWLDRLYSWFTGRPAPCIWLDDHLAPSAGAYDRDPVSGRADCEDGVDAELDPLHSTLLAYNQDFEQGGRSYATMFSYMGTTSYSSGSDIADYNVGIAGFIETVLLHRCAALFVLFRRVRCFVQTVYMVYVSLSQYRCSN
jgi:hypothetical protein